MKFKTWLKNNWAEMIFLLSVTMAMFFILRGTGYF